MQYSRLIFFFMALCVFVFGSVDSALAATKLSDLVNNMKVSWGSFQNIGSAIAWIGGAFLGVQAIYHFKQHVDNPQQTPLSYGVKRMIAGGMLLSLPFSINAVVGSLYGKGASVGANKVTATGMNALSTTPGALDQMVVDVMKDIALPLENMLTAFSYLAGLGLLLVAISRLTKRMEEGPKGPAGFGTIMTFIASGMLFNYGSSMGAFASSIFGNNQLMTRITVDPTVISNAADAQRIETVLGALEIFVMIVGYIAFIRGWFVMKNFADGQQGATLAQGLTFLIGGAIAINLGELVNAVQTTVGVTGLTFS